MYLVNKDIKFDCGFSLNSLDIIKAIESTQKVISVLPWNLLYQAIDFKTTSAIMGALFCKGIADVTEGIVNPIEKGHPDVVPADAVNATEEQLRNYPVGLEVKCTVGNVKTGSNLSGGTTRIEKITGITWQAHHREVEKLLGIVYDFLSLNDTNEFYPIITGVFYANNLSEEDWGQISGTSGRNTKVCGMKASGREKMGNGWVAIIDNDLYIERYSKLLGIKNL